MDVARLIEEADTSQSGSIDARLYRTWAEKSGEMMDWFTDVMAQHDVEVVLESASPDPSLDEHIYYPPICHNTYGFGFPYNPDGPNYGMYAHVVALEAHFTEAGGTIAFETPAQQLVQDESGRVTGVIAQNKDGQYVQYNAAKGVIVCTGGYAGNLEMIHELVPETDWCAMTSATGDTGDGIRMAEAVGAGLVGMEYVLAIPFWGGRVLDYPGAEIFLTARGESIHR